MQYTKGRYKSFVTDENLLLHKVAKRKFKENDFFQIASLKDLPLVQKDKVVKVVLSSRSVKLSFETKALNSGKKGEEIYFRNPFTNKLQLGTVVAKDLVEL